MTVCMLHQLYLAVVDAAVKLGLVEQVTEHEMSVQIALAQERTLEVVEYILESVVQSVGEFQLEDSTFLELM